jgi:hypothetical protein
MGAGSLLIDQLRAPIGTGYELIFVPSSTVEHWLDWKELKNQELVERLKEVDDFVRKPEN